MSERFTSSPEQNVPMPEKGELTHELLSPETSTDKLHNEPSRHLEQIRANIEHEAMQSNATKEQLRVEEQQPVHHHYVTKKIKSAQYQETLKHVRHSLPKNQRRFSTFVHQPAIEQVSELGAKTIARPTGIIGGALFALIGGTIILWVGKHIGFEVPNSIFAILFIVGFMAGIVIEILKNLMTSLIKKKH
jgi:hypothetical protein